MSSGIRHLITAVATGSALSAGLLPAPPAEASASTYAASAFHTTNHQRVDHDRASLRGSQCLKRHASRWARVMGTRVGMRHQALRPILRDCHLSWVGENIAYGFPSGRSVVNRGWMRSTDHRENILRPQFQRMAIGVYRDRHGTWWVSQLFGRPA